jgi:hypothetical protein
MGKHGSESGVSCFEWVGWSFSAEAMWGYIGLVLCRSWKVVINWTRGSLCLPHIRNVAITTRKQAWHLHYEKKYSKCGFKK